MNYIEAMKIQKRMLGATKESGCHTQCQICSYHKNQTGKDCTCDEFPLFYPELAEIILTNWNTLNPPKTRFQAFLDAFPNAPLEPETKVPIACVEDIWRDAYCTPDESNDFGFPVNNCVACWHSPAE